MILVIPAAPTGSILTQRVVLDGVAYSLRLAWNERCHHWTMRLEDDAGATIRGDVKLVHGAAITLRLTGDARPPGELWCHDTRHEDPGLRDLGRSSHLIYVEDASCA